MASFTISEHVRYYVWGMLKDMVCSNIPCTEDNLKESIQNIVSALSPAKLWHAVDSVLIICD
jgi:hypothetical protein